MPLYDYQCQHCQAIFEVRASFKEKEAGLYPECPQCHSPETRQILTAGMLLHSGGETSSCGSHIHTGSGCCGK